MTGLGDGSKSRGRGDWMQASDLPVSSNLLRRVPNDDALFKLPATELAQCSHVIEGGDLDTSLTQFIGLRAMEAVYNRDAERSQLAFRRWHHRFSSGATYVR